LNIVEGGTTTGTGCFLGVSTPLWLFAGSGVARKVPPDCALSLLVLEARRSPTPKIVAVIFGCFN
jgi:hypothetical protein